MDHRSPSPSDSVTVTRWQVSTDHISKFLSCPSILLSGAFQFNFTKGHIVFYLISLNILWNAENYVSKLDRDIVNGIYTRAGQEWFALITR